MPNSIEKLPMSSGPEKPEEKEIEIVRPIGERKRTPEEIERAKQIREEIEREKIIKEKLKEGKLLSKEEAAFLREKELAQEAKEAEVKEKIEEKPPIEEKLPEEKLPTEEKPLLEEKLPEVEKPPEKVEKEKTREELKKDLEGKRKDFIEANREVKKVAKKIFKLKGTKKEIFDKALDVVKRHIEKGNKEKFIEELTEFKELKAKKIKITKEQAEAIYEAELKKTEYRKGIYDIKENLEKEGKKGEFGNFLLKETEFLKQAEVESRPPKERNRVLKLLDRWAKKPLATRIAISAAIGTGVFAATGGAGIFVFGARRVAQIVGAIGVSKIVGLGIDKIRHRIIEAKAETALAQLREKIIKKGTISLKDIDEIQNQHIKILEETLGRRRRLLCVKTVAMVAAGAGTAIGVGMFAEGLGLKPAIPEAPPKPGAPLTPEEFKARYPGARYEMEAAEAKAKLEEAIRAEAISEVKPEYLPIGERGPEGAIIDYFRENPEMAVEKFGCPEDLLGPKGEITDLEAFEKWAGTKAHKLWLEEAEEVLYRPGTTEIKPEIAEQLKKLGYSSDAEGYAKMMHRIGKGFVELDPKTGKINLVDMEYLKAKIRLEAIPEKPVARPLTTEEIGLAEERISKPAVEMPPAKSTEEIFAGVSPEVGRTIITEKLHEILGMWSGAYDKFSDRTLEEFLKFDNSAYYRNINPPWEDYNYHEFSSLQRKLEAVYEKLSPVEKSSAVKLSVENFIKKYYLKVFP